MSVNRKAVIGVTPAVSFDKKVGYRYSVQSRYCQAIEAAGGVAMVLPPNPEDVDTLLPLLDGVLFTGGGDIDPYFYGQQGIHPQTYGINDLRDNFEFSLMAECIRWNLPVMGICRGLQLINVAFGGSLWQDINDQRSQDILHSTSSWSSTNGKYKSYSPYHTVRVKGGFMEEIYGTETVKANSYHHQAIRILGKDIKAIGRAGDGVVEAIMHTDPNRFIFGVQYHPEMMYTFHKEHLKPFQRLVKEAKDYATAIKRGVTPVTATPKQLNLVAPEAITVSPVILDETSETVSANTIDQQQKDILHATATDERVAIVN